MSFGRCFAIIMILQVLFSGCAEKKALPETGQLYVATEPDGATLLCNNITKGVTPATISNLEPGEHLVTVRKSGYNEARRTVFIHAGQRLALEMTMEPVLGLLLVTSDPEGADVKIGEAHRGQTPLFLNDLPPGRHQLTFSIRSYLPKTIEATIRDRTPVRVSTELVPDFAVVRFESDPEGADVFIKGNRRGKTPFNLSRLSSGAHSVEFKLEGYADYSEDFVVQAGQTRSVTASLKSLPSTFQVITDPEGARIFASGQFKGIAPVSFSVTPGEYTVRAELQGYEDAISTNSIAGGKESVIRLVLQKNSGLLVLTTEPAGVSVFLNGESIGSTRVGDTIQISEPFKIDMLKKGDHTLQLTKDGFFPVEKIIKITPEQVLPLHEKLNKIPVPFIPDVAVTIRTEAGGRHTHRGMLKSRANGDIVLEIAPGVIREFKASVIINVEMLSQERKSGSETNSPSVR